MSLTFIDTNTLSKKTTAGHGDVTEILTESLCGAHNVHGSVRWLTAGKRSSRKASIGISSFI